MTNTCRKCHRIHDSTKTLCSRCQERQRQYSRRYYRRKDKNTYQEIWKRSSERERRLQNKKDETAFPWSVADIEHIVRNLWQQRCVVTGKNERLVICRWDNERQLSLCNHVCMSACVALRHRTVIYPTRHYSNCISSEVLMRLQPLQEAIEEQNNKDS